MTKARPPRRNIPPVPILPVPIPSGQITQGANPRLPPGVQAFNDVRATRHSNSDWSDVFGDEIYDFDPNGNIIKTRWLKQKLPTSASEYSDEFRDEVYDFDPSGNPIKTRQIQKARKKELPPPPPVPPVPRLPV